MYASSLYSWYCIHGLNQMQIVYNTVVFTINTKKKNYTCEWTHTFQAHVVQGSIVLNSFFFAK